MRSAFKALLAALALAVSSNASALVNWDWTFENVASVQPHDTVYVRATLSNDLSSTASLNMPFMFASASFDSPLLGGLFNNAYPGMGFGHGDASPFTTFYPFISSQVLQPGQSVSFDFIWFSPQPAGAPARHVHDLRRASAFAWTDSAPAPCHRQSVIPCRGPSQRFPNRVRRACCSWDCSPSGSRHGADRHVNEPSAAGRPRSPADACAHRGVATRGRQSFMPSPVERALLFTDVVDSTRRVERLGDARAASVWAAHDRRARDLLARTAAARSIAPTASSCSSTTRSDAARFALAYHEALAALRLSGARRPARRRRSPCARTRRRTSRAAPSRSRSKGSPSRSPRA